MGDAPAKTIPCGGFFIPADMHDQLRELGRRTDRSRSAIIRIAIRRLLLDVARFGTDALNLPPEDGGGL